MGSDYQDISIAGGDTGQPRALQKRLRWIEKYRVPRGSRFLDCGCGAGEYVFALVDRYGIDAHGIEYSIEKVRAAATQPGGERITQGNLEGLASESNAWDYAMLNEVLEHVPDESRALGEVHRVLKPGGLLFVFSPNRWFPFETHGVYSKRSGRLLPAWTPLIPYLPVRIGKSFFNYWARNYWHHELQQLVRSAGFQIVETGFIWQTFENVSGRQPKLIRMLSPILRGVANLCESLPLVRRFGVSQVLVCRKT